MGSMLLNVLQKEKWKTNLHSTTSLVVTYINKLQQGRTKVVGGKNGYGAKLTNIFSRSFKLETVDRVRGKKYNQQFAGNMKIIKKPKISDYSGKPYTKITWTTDFERFGITGYTDDMINLMMRRVYDIAGITDKSVSVYLNKKKLSIKSFLDYSKMYLDEETIVYDELILNNILEDWCLHHLLINLNKYIRKWYLYAKGKHVDMISKQITSGLKLIVKKCKRDVNELILELFIVY